MKSLTREEDVQSTKKAMEQKPSWFLGIPDKRTPWYFINLDYADGYVHWYPIGTQKRRIVCAGGLKGKGFATTDCPICAYTLELYQEATRLEEENGKNARSNQLRERANDLHGKGEVQFKVIRGQRTLLKTKAGKEWIADWDMEDEDSTVGVGIISLSEAQFSGLTGMIKGEGTEFIQIGDGLGKRILWTAKERRKGRGGGKYSAVVWDADEEESAMPDEIEIEEELLDMDLKENFVIEEEEIEKVYTLLSGQEVEEPAEDEKVELEDDSKEEPEDADLDDLEEDEDPSAKEEEEFEDDIPEEEEEEEPEPPKAKRTVAKKTMSTRKSTTTGKATARKSTGGTLRKSGTRKSGKARL